MRCGPGGFPGGQSGESCEADLSPHSSAEVKNEWRHIRFIISLHAVHEDLRENAIGLPCN
jgi:hypothetical protein